MQKEKAKNPNCVGIIMDGNRRWAKEKGLHSFEGHKIGFNKIKEVADWSIKEGISNLIFYTFSVENWQRSKDEVSYLMGLIKIFASKDITSLKTKDVKISFIG